MSRRWQGTALFAAIMAAVSVTVAGRMLTTSMPSAPVADAGTASSGQTTGSSPAPSGTAAAGASASASPSTTAPASGGTTTVVGDTEQTAYGPVQVELIYTGSRITKVQVLQAPEGSGRDQMLTSYAVPQLNQEVLASQSARIDSISGATYTSGGYIASLQSAIDKHG